MGESEFKERLEASLSWQPPCMKISGYTLNLKSKNYLPHSGLEKGTGRMRIEFPQSFLSSKNRK